MSTDSVRAVIFDLDDTLYLQQSFLDAAWHHVAEFAAQRSSVPRQAWYEKLSLYSSQGSDRGGIIDRAVADLDPSQDIQLLVDRFRSFAPESLPLIDNVEDALTALHAVVPLGLITDGDVTIQRAKIAALGIAHHFDAIVISDEIGREFRKPHPAPFRAALEALGVPASHVVYVGDRPEKDVAGAASVGMRAIRVRTGEYAARESQTLPWHDVADVLEAISVLRTYIAE